jgi:hypothetical protein
MGKRSKDRKRKGGGGRMISMRSGFQSLVGTKKSTKKPKPLWNAISWILVAALAGAAIFLFLRRYL